MSLLASVCNVKVIIPPAPSAAVVAGSAMLGRYAHDVTKERQGQPIETQKQQEESANKSKEALWQIMVCPKTAVRSFVSLIRFSRPT
jgi:ribulose kinase